MSSTADDNPWYTRTIAGQRAEAGPAGTVPGPVRDRRTSGPLGDGICRQESMVRFARIGMRRSNGAVRAASGAGRRRVILASLTVLALVAAGALWLTLTRIVHAPPGTDAPPPNPAAGGGAVASRPALTVPAGARASADWHAQAAGFVATVTRTPLAYVPINGDGGTTPDLLLASADGAGHYFNVRDLGRFALAFVDVTEVLFGVDFANWLPARTSGLAVADFDGDGYDDFFACIAAGSRLYRLDPAAGGRYVDITASHLPDLPDTTFAAVWCDYDGDGWLDLALAGVNDGSDGIRIYRNEPGLLRLVRSVPVPLDDAAAGLATPEARARADLERGGCGSAGAWTALVGPGQEGTSW